ncbi:MAG: Hemerythrin cation binding domain [Miltoncostaeaceae bacterium]|nr:Hemerythrin cation binding domain [Miltoncostaeaceae bacterium]
MARGDATPADVSIHHQRALARARALGRAAHGGTRARREAGRAFLRYFEREVLPHCRDEERTLFPLMVSHHAPSEAVTLTLAEHEWLQVLARRLQVALEAGAPDRELLEAIAGLLVRHTDRQERELRPVIGSEAGRRFAGHPHPRSVRSTMPDAR